MKHSFIVQTALALVLGASSALAAERLAPAGDLAKHHGSAKLQAWQATNRTQTKVAFEVAPSPENVELTKLWGDLPGDMQTKISDRVIAEALWPMLEEYGQLTTPAGKQLAAEVEIAKGRGGWEGASNTSYSLVVTEGDAILLAQTIGEILSQQAVYIFGNQEFDGSQPAAEILIDVGEHGTGTLDERYHEIFTKLRATRQLNDDSGQTIVQGYSANDGVMQIALPANRHGNYFINEQSALSFAQRMVAVLAEKDGVGSDFSAGIVFSNLIFGEDNGYEKDVAEKTGKAGWKRLVDKFRAAANRIIAQEIAEFERGGQAHVGGPAPFVRDLLTAVAT